MTEWRGGLGRWLVAGVAELGRSLAVAAWALAALIAVAAAPAGAATGAWQSRELVPGVTVQARLIAAVEGAGTLNGVPAGLQVRLPPGWKTYWRAPGDAGLPPRIEWAGSVNLADAVWSWPAPHRFTLLGLETFGYEDEVVFPLRLVPSSPGAAMTLAGRLDLLVCSELCVPASFDLILALPAGPAAPDAAMAALINRYAARVPGDGAAAGLAIEAVAASPDGRHLRLAASAREPFATPDVFVEAAAGWAFGAPAVTVAGDGRRLVADLPVVQRPAATAPLEGTAVTLTLVDGPRAAERAATVAPAADGPAALAGPMGGTPDEATAPPDRAGLLAMLGVALLGGLILNLMPCVLPVLSLKLLSVVGHGGGSRRAVRLGFLASAAGILASFLVLAAVAAALRTAGITVGWGLQFQQPVFLVLMVVVLTLFACNLLGLFEIVLPWRLTDAAGHWGGAPGDALDHHALAGAFVTGAFATLLATPCSAPFLGTAVGFALARGPGEIVAIFAALGIGLALPYLAVAAMPGLATRLPRPGRWMIVLRRVLGLALVVTALWLLTVLAAQLAPLAAAVVGGLMAAMALTLWGRRHWGGGARRAGAAAAALLALAAFAAPGQLGRPAGAAVAEPGEGVRWQPFDEAAIPGLVAQGRVVFVDVTADWCLTCQVNKAVVLDRGAAAAALAAENIVLMRADWTRPDESISAFLARHGRYGIPFNAVYGPGTPHGRALPELLSAEAVIEALGAAASPGG